MHQDAAHGVEAGTSIFILSATRFIEDADRLLRLPGKTEFCRVMQDENRSICRREAFPGGLKMPGQNCRLIDSPVGKEPIRHLGVRPILAG